jgi:hypothetical protein
VWFSNDNSSLTFTPGNVSVVLRGPTSVFIADIDRDGFLDVVGGGGFARDLGAHFSVLAGRAPEPTRNLFL